MDKKKVDKFTIRFFKYPGLLSQTKKIAKYQGISTNELIQNAIYKYNKGVNMDSKISVKTILEKERYLERYFSNWKGFILLLLKILCLFILPMIFPFFVLNGNDKWDIIEIVFCVTSILISLSILVYFIIKTDKLINWEIMNGEQVIDIVEKIGENLLEPLEIESNSAIVYKETKFGKIYKWNSMGNGKINLDEEKQIGIQISDYILIYPKPI